MMTNHSTSPTVRIVLQARMGSQRRPGKTMVDIAGQPLLARCLERLEGAVRRGVAQGIGGEWQLVVATSTADTDDAIEQFAGRHGFACVRGSEEDVLSRYLDTTADLGDCDIVVRATADNPLYCPERTVRLVAAHLSANAHYTGITETLSACVPEAFKVGALRHAASRLKLDDYCREHVTPCFRRPGSPFRKRFLRPTWQGLAPHLRLTVDTPDDVDRMDRMYRALIVATGSDDASTWSLSQIYRAAAGLTAADRELPAAA